MLAQDRQTIRSGRMKMLRFLFLLMRTRFLQLSRYLKMSLTTSCDLPPSHDPSSSTPTGYEQPRPQQVTSCGQPPSHGPQDQECEQATSSLDLLWPSPRASAHVTRGAERVHSLLLPATSELRTASAHLGCPHGPRPTGPGRQGVSTLSSSQLRAASTPSGHPHKSRCWGPWLFLRAAARCPGGRGSS